MIKDDQPFGLYLLTLGELFERFSFYGAQAILVLYLVNILHFSDAKSYVLYGVFTTFAYALPVVGGLVADKLLGAKTAVISGSILLIIGNVLLALPGSMTFFIGLAILTCGTGLYKSNSSGLVGTLYSPEDKRRDSGFTLFYMGMNIGAVIGSIIYGLATKILGWHSGFLISAIGISLALGVFIYKLPKAFATKTQKTHYSLNTRVLAIFLIMLLCGFVSFIFFKPFLLAKLLLIFAVVLLGGIIFAAIKYSPHERNRIFALLMLSFFAMCFFAASLQVTSSISLFIERSINREIGHWQIPTILFSSLYPLAVIIFAPFLSWFWKSLSNKNKEPDIGNKFALGLFFCSIAFIAFALASMTNFSNYTQIIWIIVGNFCLGLGELIIFPTLLAAISRFAPENLQGTMMGVSFLFVAFGGYISSLIAQKVGEPIKFISYFDNVFKLDIYGNFFVEIFLGMLLVVLIVLLFNQFFRKMTKIF